MRTLRFIVDNASIKQDPTCDFGGLFPGRNPEVRAEFIFSNEWKDTIKVASFWSMLDAEYEPQLLDNDSCIIPREALSRASFKVQVLGKKIKSAYDQSILSTNKVTIRQTGGKR